MCRKVRLSHRHVVGFASGRSAEPLDGGFARARLPFLGRSALVVGPADAGLGLGRIAKNADPAAAAAVAATAAMMGCGEVHGERMVRARQRRCSSPETCLPTLSPRLEFA